MYRPLPSFLTISGSSIDGLALYTTTPLEANLELGICHIKDERFENGYSRTPLGGFINHSPDPNCKLYEEEGFLKLRTLKEADKGAELTLCYTLYEVEKS